MENLNVGTTLMKKYKLLVLGFLVELTLIGCTSHTEKSERVLNRNYPDGYQIKVKKVDIKTSTQGVLTGHIYGDSHSYRYSFQLSPGGIYWEGGSYVPTQFIVCGNELHLHFLALVSQGQSENQKYVVKSQYAQHVDDRYFFKLLGQQYWMDNVEAEFKKSNNCKPYNIPNEGDLELRENKHE